MKNKKLTYVLIALVVLIWGFFFYVLFGPTETVGSTYVPVDLEPDEKQDTIQFQELDLNYSDPFLNRKIVAVSGVSENTGSVNNQQPKKVYQPVKPVQKVEPTIIWPKIEYGGTVNNSKGLIKINNSLRILEHGEGYNEVNILGIYPDSIQVEYKGEKKSITKNKY